MKPANSHNDELLKKYMKHLPKTMLEEAKNASPAPQKLSAGTTGRSGNTNANKKWSRIGAIAGAAAALVICVVAGIVIAIKLPNSLNTISENEVGDDHNSSAVSSTVSIEFDSLGELQNALNLENENKLFSYFLEQGVGSKQIETIRNMVKTIRLRNNIVPYLNGKVIELRNEEGFGNITMFSSEKYGLPCIFYHPTVSNSENLYIKVTCIPDEFLHERETPIASDLIKIMAPGYPNIDNTGNYCSAVYNTNIKLLDCEVTALVYEYKTDNRNSTLFVYDNLLIEVRNDPEIWGMNWFSTLSFSEF